MRKTLLIAAAALAGSILSSQAQVYSLNIVGYANTPLPVGYSLINVPLSSDGTANPIPATNVLACLQSGDAVIVWNGAGYSTYSYLNGGPGATWVYPDGSTLSDVPPSLHMGQGFFYQNGQPSPETNTFVGTVVTNIPTTLVVGYNMIGSIAPVGGSCDSTNFNYPLQSGDALIFWNGAGYSTYSYLNGGPGATWVYPDGSTLSDVAPTVNVGQGFFYQNGQPSGETWNQNFSIH